MKKSFLSRSLAVLGESVPAQTDCVLGILSYASNKTYEATPMSFVARARGWFGRNILSSTRRYFVVNQERRPDFTLVGSDIEHLVDKALRILGGQTENHRLVFSRRDFASGHMLYMLKVA